MNVTTEQKLTDLKVDPINADLTVADAVWIAAALLQRKHPDRVFSTEDIANSVRSLNLTVGVYKSIWQHVNQHCVANRAAQPNRACMLWGVGQGNRRLFRRGDRPHPDRKDGRQHPTWNNLPPEYADLQDWYETVWNKQPVTEAVDPLLALIGTGRDMWEGKTADEYVASLRGEWKASV